MRFHSTRCLGIGLLALLTMSFQCGREILPAVEPDHRFLENLNLWPYKKVYSVGDTVWVQFPSANHQLYDGSTGSYVTMDTININYRFLVHRRYPIPATEEYFGDVVLDSVANPQFAPLYPWYNQLRFSTACNSANYGFRLCFVPKKTGYYTLEPRGDLQLCPGRTRHPNSTFHFRFNLADCNLDIWQQVPSSAKGGDNGFTDSQIAGKEIFMFRVQ